jgi:hypothetical protein
MHDDATATGAAASRALVCAAEPVHPGSAQARPDAAFLTQLLACEARLPPYRRGRRAAPEDGASSYEGPVTFHAPRFERVL